MVITDSGGIQEETTFLGISRLTARPNTERPITITSGTNRLVASEFGALAKGVRVSFYERKLLARPELWDGQAATRIVNLCLVHEPPGAPHCSRKHF